MGVVDEYIPDPIRQLDKPFLMSIEDVFSIQGKGEEEQKENDEEDAGKELSENEEE
ncbi:hypothetical protein KSP40_PGU003781 [Platanthera guangdongensis]|uniref:Uncharacterized protein n=1 Tax=Platanthera guangdongensis TaxID=2320717 RepID=A0ABR2MA84_9ASPA